MQAQSLEDIFLNDDVMQGGIVWNAVPDYMFTTGQFFYRVKYLHYDAKLQAVNQDNPFFFFVKKTKMAKAKKLRISILPILKPNLFTTSIITSKVDQIISVMKTETLVLPEK